MSGESSAAGEHRCDSFSHLHCLLVVCLHLNSDSFQSPQIIIRRQPEASAEDHTKHKAVEVETGESSTNQSADMAAASPPAQARAQRSVSPPETAELSPDSAEWSREKVDMIRSTSAKLERVAEFYEESIAVQEQRMRDEMAGRIEVRRASHTRTHTLTLICHVVCVSCAWPVIGCHRLVTDAPPDDARERHRRRNVGGVESPVPEHLCRQQTCSR